MPFMDKLCKAVFLIFLGMGTALGAAVDPKEIEETLRLMNQSQIELTLPSKDEPK